MTDDRPERLIVEIRGWTDEEFIRFFDLVVTEHNRRMELAADRTQLDILDRYQAAKRELEERDVNGGKP